MLTLTLTLTLALTRRARRGARGASSAAIWTQRVRTTWWPLTPNPNDLAARHNAVATHPDPYPSSTLTLSRTRTPNQVARHNAMAKAAVRDQLLGVDRAGRSYWLLTLDPARLWVQEAPPVPPPADVTAMGMRELKAEIASLGGQTAGLLEKI